MSTVATLGALIGVAIVVMAGIGLLRFHTLYARIHAAGKASPVAFLVVAGGVGLELGGPAAARLALASVALILTLPAAVHLLFRAVHTATPQYDPPTNELSR